MDTRQLDSFINFENGTMLWTGVVEDRADPMQMGRIRVRIFGIHPADRSEVPTDTLPWASIVIPLTENGAGTVTPSCVEGNWVIGFFRDGASCQDPVVFGILPGLEAPDWQNHQKVGGRSGGSGGSGGGIIDTVVSAFSDVMPEAFGSLLDPFQKVKSIVEQVMSVVGYPYVGTIPGSIFDDALAEFHVDSFVSGKHFDFENIKVPIEQSFQDIRRNLTESTASGALRKKPIAGFPIHPAESDISRIARGDETVYKPGGMKYNYDKNKDSAWEEPDMDYAAVYPYNHYSESESGHIFEFDDTPDHERLQIKHKSGSGYHVNPDGTTKTEIHGDDFHVSLKDKKLHVYGNLEVFCDTGTFIEVGGEADIRVGKDAHISVQENCWMDVGFKLDISANCDINLSSGRDINIEAENQIKMIAKHKGPRRIYCKDPKDFEMPENDASFQIISEGTLKLHATNENNGYDLTEDFERIPRPPQDEFPALRLISDHEYEQVSKEKMNIISLEEGIFNRSHKIISSVSDTIINEWAPNNTKIFIDTEPAENEFECSLRETELNEVSLTQPYNLLNIQDEVEGRHGGIGGKFKEAVAGGTSQGQYKENLVAYKRNDAIIPSPSSGGVDIKKPHPIRFKPKKELIKLEPPNEFKESHRNHPYYNQQISEYFYFSDLTWNPMLSKGNFIDKFSTTGPAWQLIKLANVLDPLAEECKGHHITTYQRKPGNLQILSAYRRNDKGPHGSGQAVDVRVIGVNPNQYCELAKHISGLLGCTVILNYSPSRMTAPWIHIDISGGRAMQYTHYDDVLYSEGFVNLASWYYGPDSGLQSEEERSAHNKEVLKLPQNDYLDFEFTFDR